MKKNYLFHAEVFFRRDKGGYSVNMENVLVRVDKHELEKMEEISMMQYLFHLGKAEIIRLLATRPEVHRAVYGELVEIDWGKMAYKEESRKDYVVYFTDGTIRIVNEYPSDMEYHKASRFYAFHHEGNIPSHRWFSESKNWLKE